MKKKILLNALFMAGLAAGGAAVAAESVDILMYKVMEPGVGIYDSRVLVSPKFMRLDDGVDSGDFALFDRNKKVIYSVSHEDRTVFEIPSREVTVQPPEPIVRSVETIALEEDTPRVAGQQPVNYQLSVNGETCYNVVTVEGVLPDYLKAMKAFRKVLAGEHALALPSIPADMRDNCDLARHTFAPDWQLQFGLPIQEWDELGGGQSLIDFKTGQRVDDKLFQLPEGYQHYSN